MCATLKSPHQPEHINRRVVELQHVEKLELFHFLTAQTKAGPLVGKVSPAFSRGVGSKATPRYEALAPLHLILAEINAHPELPPLGETALRALLKSFASGPPREKPKPQKPGRRWQKRKLEPMG